MVVPVDPLQGIRVLDLTQIVSGPTCTFLLAALGAEVIHLEPPGGEINWKAPPFFGPGGVNRGLRRPDDIPLSPLRRGRNKRSVVIDLKTEEGRRLFERLVEVSDVVVENFRAGTMERLGIDYPVLERLNPRIVYCTITGYGHDGPYRDRSSMDLVVQAVSGLLSKTGFTDGPPTKVGVTIGDQVPGIYAALGVLAALRQREIDGRGQVVDVAMLDALVALLWDEPLDDYETRGFPERVGNGDPRAAPLGVFETADGWLALVVTSETQWESLCEMMERRDLAERAQGLRGRAELRDEINEGVAAWLRPRTTAELVEALTGAGIACGPVQRAWGARDDPQVAHRGMLEALRHPAVAEPSPFLGPRLPFKLSRAHGELRPAEPLGASTGAVLSELLGLGEDELAGLRERGVIEGEPADSS